MKTVQETLGLSSITIAADTYTSVLPGLARRAAEDVAALLKPAINHRRVPGRAHDGQAVIHALPATPSPAADSGPDTARDSHYRAPATARDAAGATDYDGGDVDQAGQAV